MKRLMDVDEAKVVCQDRSTWQISASVNMNKVVVCLLLACACAGAAGEGTELLFTLLIHRHGDRTPEESSLPLSTDPEKLRNLSERYGFGELTKRGVQRGYELGQHLRARYDGFIARTYNRSELFVRSTDSPRAKMTVLAAMAALFPPGPDRAWNPHLPWTPVPYTTVPSEYDFNFYMLTCPVAEAATQAYTFSKPDALFPYADVIRNVSDSIGYKELMEHPVLIHKVNEAFANQISLGIPLPPKLEAIYPKIKEAAGVAMKAIIGDDETAALAGGVLLHQFVHYSGKLLAGDDTPRMRIYSAHDMNVLALLAVTGVEYSLGVPAYGSAYALELRRVAATGQLVVAPVYLPSPGEKVVHLNVEGCGQLCDYQQFLNITSKFALDEDTWHERCAANNLETTTYYGRHR